MEHRCGNLPVEFSREMNDRRRTLFERKSYEFYIIHFSHILKHFQNLHELEKIESKIASFSFAVFHEYFCVYFHKKTLAKETRGREPECCAIHLNKPVISLSLIRAHNSKNESQAWPGVIGQRAADGSTECDCEKHALSRFTTRSPCITKLSPMRHHLYMIIYDHVDIIYRVDLIIETARPGGRGKPLSGVCHPA